MKTTRLSGLGALVLLALALVTLPRCELLVDVDRSEVDAGLPDGCSICTAPTEGGEDAEAAEGGADGAILADAATEAGSDGTVGDGAGEAAIGDSGSGE